MNLPSPSKSHPRSSDLDAMLDDLFHGAAFAAFVTEAIESGKAPCPTATKYRAYAFYEAGLAEKNKQKELLDS